MDGRGTRSVYILPTEHLVFISLLKNPPQPLRPDWRVACVEAHCLPAGRGSKHARVCAHTHANAHNIIFPHKNNRAVAAGLLRFPPLPVFVRLKTLTVKFPPLRCFHPLPD